MSKNSNDNILNTEKEVVTWIQIVEFTSTLRDFINGDDQKRQLLVATGLKLGIDDWLKRNEMEKTIKFLEPMKELDFYTLKTIYTRVYHSFKNLYEKDPEKYKAFKIIERFDWNLEYLATNLDYAFTLFVFATKRQKSLVRMILSESGGKYEK